MNIAIGFDVGTTAIKTSLVSDEGVVLGAATREQTQSYPHPGWVEQDPLELFNLCTESYYSLLHETGLTPADISCIGIDHQGESVLVWDKESGKPVYPVITWQDRRMAQISDEYGRRYGEKIQELTGLRSDSYYSAWKIRWILDNVPNGQNRAELGELLAGTLNTWLIWCFTKGNVFATDESSTNVMMLCNPRTADWNDWLLNLINIPRNMLPEIRPSNEFFGYADPSILGTEIPITASLTDGSAGSLAGGAIDEGKIIVTYGTGNFLHLITGDTYVSPEYGLTSSCCFVTKEKRMYQLNGICYSAGSAISWMKDQVGILDNAIESGVLAKSVPNTGGVYFVPAINGLATPYWDQSARGAFLGLTAASSKAHLVRAVLESSALQVAHCYNIMNEVSNLQPQSVIAMGGMIKNDFLMQIQADYCGVPVELPLNTEPSLGAAWMALSGLEIGITLDDLKTFNPIIKTFNPTMNKNLRDELLNRWKYAVKRTLNWDPNNDMRNNEGELHGKASV